MNSFRRLRLLAPMVLLPVLLAGHGAASAATPAPLAGAASQAVPPLTTPWTDDVSPTAPLPEYPRPQMVRPDWLNLNGPWDFAQTDRGTPAPAGYGEQILVPYPVESALSGIQRTVDENDELWYRRSFTVPDGWTGRDLLLHFGAVDWQATVFVNGREVGAHTGGYDAFSIDVTDAVRPGANELVVRAWDPTDRGGQAIGKQRVQPSGIFYTAASGIWQTVWLEPVAPRHVARVDVTPDVPGERLRVTVRGGGEAAGTGAGTTAEVTVTAAGAVVGTATGAVGTELQVPVPDPRLWSPDDPFLYDLSVRLVDGGTTLDEVTGYAGMRSIGLATVDGVTRPVLNGEFVFQVGTLDQGYWPDGIYTAPTDEALRFDLQAHKDLGYNLVRKHIKVEPQRWFHWADRIGLLVWQDMPSMDLEQPAAAARPQFEAELREMIDEHRSSPSVVTWVPFNEGWGEYDAGRITDDVKAYDPSRLVNANSGSANCCNARDPGNGDFVDDHTYVGPSSPGAEPTRAAALGEFGGLGLRVPGHEWSPGNGFSYENQADGEALTQRYVGLMDATRSLLSSQGLSAAVYTELTDVENEVNGLWTYDRQVLKVDAQRVRAAHQALIAASDGGDPVSLPVGEYRSLRVTTPGFTDRSLRHRDGLARTDVVTGDSPPLLREDGTFRVVAGLANASCFSFEARNAPGSYLRHAFYRVRLAARDGSELFDRDATFCARTGLSGTGVSFEALNEPGRYLRHVDEQVWISDASGTNPWDAPRSFADDVSWDVATPWAP